MSVDPKGVVAKRCQYFSTDQPGVGHCPWCAEGGLCPDDEPVSVERERDERLGVRCGMCGGTVYMHTCDEEHGTAHYWVLWSECQRCGTTHHTKGCPDCEVSRV